MDDDIKKVIEEQGQVFAEFKRANDAVQAEVKKLGSADTVLVDKLEKLNSALDGLTEAKSEAEKKQAAEAKRFDEMEKEIGRLRAGSGPSVENGGIDVKTFNAHRQSRQIHEGGLDVSDADAQDYAKHFAKFLRKGEGYSEAERKAMSVGSDPDGGYLVTPNVSGRVVTRVFETSEIRKYAASQTIGTDALEGGRDIGEGAAGWVGEADTRSVTSTPQLGAWRIPTHEMYAMPDATQKMLDDANMDVEAWLATKTGDKMGRMENAAFVNGTGVLQPRGFVTYPVNTTPDATRTWGNFEYVPTGAAGAFAASSPADCLMDLVHKMKPMYLQNATWFLPRLVIAAVRKFKEASTNAYLWQPGLQKGDPESLLGFPIAKFEDMPAMAANSLSVAFGDLGQTYQIVDRAGVRVLRDPFTAKPFVRFYTTRRVGGDCIHFEALKFLKFSVS